MLKTHTQRFLHRPEEGQIGDCFRTVIACLLDVDPEQVPHFMADLDRPIPEIWKDVDAWLQERGLRHFTVPYQTDVETLLKTTAKAYPGLRWELSGRSPRGSQHSVIAQDGKIIHDPHPDGGGIVGPGDDGYLWLSVLVPVAIHGERAAA